MLTNKETVVYGGHLSRFGDAFIKEILFHPYFDVTTIVLATQNRWEKFVCQLLMLDKMPHRRKYQQHYKHKTKKILNYLQSNYPNITIQFSNDANDTNEIDNILTDKLVLSAAFPQIFSKPFLSKANLGAVNFHPSYLPRCRGANPIYWTIFSREPFGGLSAHFMTMALDGGPILARRKIFFDEKTIVFDELYKLVLEQLPAIINDTALFFKENKKTISQINEEATYFRSEQFIHRKIYWQTENLSEISAKVRAGAAFSYTASGKLVYVRPPVQIFSRSPLVTNRFDERIESGTIVKIKTNTLLIKGLDGYIILNYSLDKKLEDIPNNFLKWLNWNYLSSKIDFLDKRNLKVGEKLC